MQTVRLTAPFYVNRAVLNAEELVGLPDDVARELVSAGKAICVASDVVTSAVDGPPADKLMRPNIKKHLTHRSRHRDATLGG
jgi:hypothetical protein